MNIIKIALAFLLSLPQTATALVVYQGGTTEIEAPFTAPGSTNSYSVTLTNEAGSDPAQNFTGSFSSSEYSFLGGTFPGIGGTCPTAGSLAAGNTCTAIIEFAPISSGDNDGTLTIGYETTDFLGTIARQLILKVDGHAENSGVSCPGLAPIVTSIFPSKITTSTTSTITVFGGNFSATTSASVSGLTVNSTTITNNTSLTFDVVSGASASGFHDVTITNECGSTTQANAVEVTASTWFDLRVPADLAASNPTFTSSQISGYTIDASFGMQLNVTNQNWLKFLRFDGACGTVNQNYDIVIYRQNNVKRAMFSLWNASTTVDPYAGTNSWQRQYVGYWDAGSQLVNRVYGTQLGEGGISWNLGFTNANIPDGNYYRYHFAGAGQNSQIMQIWRVDQNLNDIALIRSFTSNKPATSATNVCPGIAPFDAGLSDYYITAIRVL